MTNHLRLVTNQPVPSPPTEVTDEACTACDYEDVPVCRKCGSVLWPKERA